MVLKGLYVAKVEDLKYKVISGGVGGIAARAQIHMGAPICVVEIHLRAILPPL